MRTDFLQSISFTRMASKKNGLIIFFLKAVVLTVIQSKLMKKIGCLMLDKIFWLVITQNDLLDFIKGIFMNYCYQ